MESLFKSGFRSFLESSYIDFIEYGNTFIFNDYDFSVELVPAYTRVTGDSEVVSRVTVNSCHDFNKIYLYEDRWWAQRQMVQARILARLERFRSVFARKCRVLTGRGNPQLGEMVREFLQKHHSYSSAKCRYRYALEYEGEIVAVATFSEGRPMVRKIGDPLQNVPKEEQENADVLIFDSYEWVRYASLPGIRVVGGMGRLLSTFIEERYTRIEAGTPLEIMTYSDTEWGSGDVYGKLGFKFAGERPPVEYHVHKETYARLSQRLYEKELLNGALPDDFYVIQNLGSRKFLMQLYR
ncbi:MAG: Smr/MutS family protein [Bacteroidales bacterium]|nr:Smr/MutS family protein [Bacteroidales bacterium]